MKSKVFLAAAVLCVAGTSHANNTDQQKINFMKQVYQDVLNDDLSVDVLELHASSQLRMFIQHRDAIAIRNQGEMCDWVRSVFIPGNDHDTVASQINYSILNNGRVRVQAKNFGEAFQIDYDVQCNLMGCKINDLYDPDSYKQELISIVKNGTC